MFRLLTRQQVQALTSGILETELLPAFRTLPTPIFKQGLLLFISLRMAIASALMTIASSCMLHIRQARMLNVHLLFVPMILPPTTHRLHAQCTTGPSQAEQLFHLSLMEAPL